MRCDPPSQREAGRNSPERSEFTSGLAARRPRSGRVRSEQMPPERDSDRHSRTARRRAEGRVTTATVAATTSPSHRYRSCSHRRHCTRSPTTGGNGRNAAATGRSGYRLAWLAGNGDATSPSYDVRFAAVRCRPAVSPAARPQQASPRARACAAAAWAAVPERRIHALEGLHNGVHPPACGPSHRRCHSPRRADGATRPSRHRRRRHRNRCSHTARCAYRAGGPVHHLGSVVAQATALMPPLPALRPAMTATWSMISQPLCDGDVIVMRLPRAA